MTGRRLSLRERRWQVVHVVILLTPWIFGAAMDATPERAALLGVEVPPCPSRLVTEHGCPGCGLTRAVVLTVHGELAAGFRVHPAVVPVLALCLLGAFVRGDLFLRGRMKPLHASLIRWGHVVFAGTVLAGWVGRATG